jgi:hypothetical protein
MTKDYTSDRSDVLVDGPMVHRFWGFLECCYRPTDPLVSALQSSQYQQCNLSRVGCLVDYDESTGGCIRSSRILCAAPMFAHQ